ncbi:hypothetical protein HY838_00720 [Candidatus Azambacteria bacterium]|nr:hypothetical protein [Candidatus Azambacteria bacterium]
MALAENLQQKRGAFKEKISAKSQESETESGAEIDFAEWLLLFLGAGYIDILFILLTIIALIPIVGLVIYAVAEPILDLAATAIFWFYLQHKGLGQYWWLAFGGGLANLIPVVNWFGWVVSVLILYFLVKAEKIPMAGEAIKEASKITPK